MPAPLKIDEILNKIETLPTLPNIVYELSQVINDPMSSTSDVESLMANDQSLTTTVLRLVNSAYYAIPGGVSSLSRAIGYIGFDTVNQLVLSTSILQALEFNGECPFDLNEFWKHSVGVGVASETVAKFVNHPLPADLFTSGLVHDMGKVVQCSIDPMTIQAITQKCRQDKTSFAEAELALGLLSHTKIGELLAKKWALPANIRDAIRHHHSKDHAQRTGLTADANRNVDIVFLGNLLTHALKFGNSGHSRILAAPRDTMERLALNPERDLKPLLSEIKVQLAKADDFLRVLAGPPLGVAA